MTYGLCAQEIRDNLFSSLLETETAGFARNEDQRKGSSFRQKPFRSVSTATHQPSIGLGRLADKKNESKIVYLRKEPHKNKRFSRQGHIWPFGCNGVYAGISITCSP